MNENETLEAACLWVNINDYVAGHADTIEELLEHLVEQVRVKAFEEAAQLCFEEAAQICDELPNYGDYDSQECAKRIRQKAEEMK